MKILDIGANEGNFYKKFCSENDFVVAVEPNPKFKNLFQNVLWEQKAVSDLFGKKVNLYLGDSSVLSSLNLNWLKNGRFANRYSGKTLLVETVTIDNLTEKYGIFDHIKIDVEGYEDKVILGMTKNYGSAIQFEWAAEWFDSVSKKTLESLKLLGYNKFNIVCGGDFDPKNLPKTHLSYEELTAAVMNQISLDGDSWGMILAQN